LQLLYAYGYSIVQLLNRQVFQLFIINFKDGLLLNWNYILNCCGRIYVEVGIAVQRKVDRSRGQKPTSCGTYYRGKCAAYVSTPIEV
jgi:hypothetical protein